MNKYKVLTSRLGYEGQIDEVETTASIDDIKKIDSRYGMKHRHESTSIKQLREGAIKEGFEFSNKTIIPMTSNWDSLREEKWDYMANFGNY